MDEFDETDDASPGEEQKKKKKKSGGSDSPGSAGDGRAVATAGFYEKMGLLGASANLVDEILRNWKHLGGQGLLQRLIEFATGKARASAHAEVEIKKGKDFGLVHNLLQTLKTLPRALTHRHNIDHHNTPQGPH